MSNNQLVDILQNMLLTPASDFYVSKLLHSPEQDSLDPCSIAEIYLGSFYVLNTLFEIVVKNLHVKGLSNTQVKFNQQGNPEIVVVGNKVSFTAKQPNTQEGYERPSDVPAQVEALGELHITGDGSPMPVGWRSQGASATPHVRCCHVYPIQPPEYRGARHHYGDALSTTDAASYCRFARPSPQHH
ncbi:hypothetical protein [Pseudomonas saxonica]|uniref:hypothetical protein n=1 Tax=Pseudomonas saxonica TaxID=2600598 RepID=UPI002D7A0A63|nr:hypothetical protein [Pseudomonas saxonica]WRQ73567.1 hypothetical protein VQY67_15515 [Pseudomonas saxonica]